jgi:hypothetical protein
MVVPTVLAITASITALRLTGASVAVAGFIDSLIDTKFTLLPAVDKLDARNALLV